MPSGAADKVARAAAALKTCCGAASPVAAIVLGSGFGGLADSIENATRIPYGELLGRGGTVEGHRGEFVHGILAGREVLVLSGRMHLYEGHPAATAVLPVRVAQAMGARTLVLSNAAGGIRRDLKAGDFMLIRDHINLMWRNPLIGTPWGGEATYDAGLSATMRGAAGAVGVALNDGVYAAVLGPSYETPAEIRMLATLGADAVGMSTVPEVLVAGELGMPVVAVCCITNAASGVTGERLSHADVLDVGRRAAGQFDRLIRAFVTRLPTVRAGGTGG
jgi:purine-nucleoside phosphorylase